ncbi:hypothetical protein GXM_02929 [Nostoc sphaeroides CCNUC1]|uniref:Uncharacterized protein n=1 Tax=Nostoc sphaeroides CCNUC1 TaxID=2653204 RepID=A0A5P8VYF1_9NOSO|nr:hypothetical protein GXM_02929 [Nostoc sphaeroides CCNUC1]
MPTSSINPVFFKSSQIFRLNSKHLLQLGVVQLSLPTHYFWEHPKCVSYIKPTL